MTTILHPTDFSDNSNRALPYAIDLVHKLDGRLALAHIHDLPILAPENPQAAVVHTQSMVEQTREEARMQLAELVKRHNLAAVPHRNFIRSGGPGDEVSRLAEEQAAKFVVMGTAGENADRGMFMGSTAAKVIRSVECPVLIVPRSAPFKPFESMVYATDLMHEEPLAIDAMVEFAKLYDARLTFLHINKDEVSISEDPKKMPFQEIIERVNYDKASYRVEMMDDVLYGIDQFVMEHGCDLIGMCTHTTSLLDRLFHNSLTKRMALHSQVPVLAFHHR